MRVMLSLLPFWAPLTPPLGIGILKSHLQRAGIEVILADFNADSQLWSLLHRYLRGPQSGQSRLSSTAICSSSPTMYCVITSWPMLMALTIHDITDW